MKHLFFSFVMLLAGTVLGQHEELADTILEKEPDTLSLYEAFQKGRTSGHFRYFFMATDNAGELSDYYANALGGGLKFESAPFHRFQFGVGGFFIYNIKSSNLSEADPTSHQNNRYELSLFDLEDPENKSDIDRLEELYIKYRRDKVRATLGKQIINTPFINAQDSRMRPTEVDGLYSDFFVGQKWRLEAGWLYGISPRSTVRWYSVARSIGINSQGVNLDRSSGQYRNNILSKGIGLFGVTYNHSEHLTLTGYNQVVENMFNTALVQVELKSSVGDNNVKAGLQYIRQDAINNGGNIDPSKTYFDKRNKVNVFGAKLALYRMHWETSLNYTRITKDGRFTMPREWGTEPLFTYLSRERNEGYADVNAIMANLKGSLPSYRLKYEIGYGHYYLPTPENGLLNKYGMPSYKHLKILGDYEFTGSLAGLDLAFLYIYKAQLDSKVYESNYIINKVNMSSYNMVVNYHF